MTSLSREQHRSREETLTQRHPSRATVAATTLVLKHDELYLLCDESGDIFVERGSEEGRGRGLGLFWRDTRFLSRYELELNGKRLIPLTSEHGAGEWTTYTLQNGELPGLGGADPVPAHSIAVRRYRSADASCVRELVEVTNFADSVQHLALTLAYAADYADIFMVRRLSGDPPGESLPAEIDGTSHVTLRYAGRDGCERSTRLTFSPQPRRLDRECAEFELSIEHGQTIEISIEIAPLLDGKRVQRKSPDGPTDPRRARTPAAPSGQALLDTAPRVRGHPLLEKIVRRGLLDLALLSSRMDGDLRYVAGGVPWYVTLFGRDSAIASMEVCAFWPRIACETVRLLARFQATSVDEYRDAEPGKVLHELRRGELARLGKIPQSPVYYGSIDSTLLFLILLGEYLEWSGDLEAVRTLRGPIDAALAWIDDFGDSDGDGYLDYRGQYGRGLVNQGWKDSGDAIVNADGSLAKPPIALCEVQGYLYRAWLTSARLLESIGEPARAAELRSRADRLRERFERDFWSDELGCYALARQEGGRTAAVVSSNAGQVLWSGIASHDHANRVAQRLMSPDMFAGWGVRTLSSREKRFNPMSYHLGSIWPHDNALILSGLKRYGCDREALSIFEALFAAASGFRDHRLPELYCGFERRAEDRHPVHYPVACSPQAWAAGSILYALVSLLGLEPRALERRLSIVKPLLPPFLDHLELERLQMAGARVDLAFTRAADGQVHVSSLVREGHLDVELVPPGG
jgi:glycogen debranching enzyme